MSVVCLPSRLKQPNHDLKASPPSILDINEDEAPRLILCNPLLIAGPAVSRSNLSKVCDFTYWTGKTRGAVRLTAYRKPITQPREVQPPPPAAQPVNQRQQRVHQNGGKKDKLSAAYQRPQPINRSAVMKARAVIGEYACPIDIDWTYIQDVSMQFLNGTNINHKGVEIKDIKFIGSANAYNKKYDLLVPRNAVEIRASPEVKELSYKIPSARGDPILADLIESDPLTQVIVTDQVLATLMSAPLSRFGWQITAYRFGDKLILDKTNVDDSNLDVLTINETVAMEQMSDVKQKELAEESAKHQIEFQQFILQNQPVAVRGELTEGEEVSAVEFDEYFQPPSNRLYRYRYVTLPPGYPIPGHQGDHCRKQPIKMAVRTEIHAANLGPDGESIQEYLKLHTLTEGLIKSPTGDISWAAGIEKHRGSLLLNEMRRNSCKITKWIYQALLASAHVVKLGFLTKKNNSLKLLTVQSCNVSDLAQQIGLRLGNGYGVIRELLDIILSDTKRGDGRYIITRDSITDNVKIHFTTFEEAEELSKEESAEE